MKIITHARELQNILKQYRNAGKQIGFVPTMGYLHEGHESLLKKARQENDIVVLSIFVNPLQFGPNEDLEKYPRDMDRDEAVAKKHDTDYIFFPTVQEMYPDGMSVSVKVTKGTDVLCGRNRPGHFDGVATVLTKLFHIVQPDKVYFGLKDAQQVAVVERMVRDFNFPLEVVRVQTVREKDGLAKSSRNVYLLEEERNEAKEIYAALLLGRKQIEEGVRDPAVIIETVRGHIEEKTRGTIDYVKLYAYPELEEPKELKGELILAAAVKFHAARLIDNIIIQVG